MRVLFFMLLLCITLPVFAVEGTKQTRDSVPTQELWAPSWLNKKIPEMKVDAWINGKPKNLEGKCILIHFWRPSYAWGAYLSIPRFNRLSKELKKDLVIIGISPSDKEYIEDIFPEILYPNASAPQFVDAVQVESFCYCLFLDPEGIVRWEGCPWLEGQNLTDKKLKSLIKKYRK